MAPSPIWDNNKTSIERNSQDRFGLLTKKGKIMRYSEAKVRARLLLQPRHFDDDVGSGTGRTRRARIVWPDTKRIEHSENRL